MVNNNNNLINKLAKLNANGNNINKGNHDGDTLLHIAAGRGNNKVIKLLLERGAKVNSTNELGETPLIHASTYFIDTVKLLLENGAKINMKDTFEERAPLHVASDYGNIVIVKFLLEKGAKVDIEDFNKKTTLFLAVFEGYKDIAKLLLKYGAKIDKQNVCGETALHIASKEGRLDMVKLLLKNGADPTKVDWDGKTALDYAESINIEIMLRRKMGLKVHYRNLRKKDKKKFKSILLKRLLIIKRNNKNFRDPITHMNYNMRTLEPVNKKFGKNLATVGLIIDNNDKPIRLVNYNTVKQYKKRATNGIIGGLLYENWSLIPFTKDELNKAYNDLERLDAMFKGARTRKNLSTLRSSTSIRHRFDKAMAYNRIKRNEKKTGKIANDRRKKK